MEGSSATPHIKSGFPHKKKPETLTNLGFLFRSLAMTYSHMGKPHTTIGEESFHF